MDLFQVFQLTTLAACELRRGEILPAISAERRTIVVAGTHGKTTTSSMLALVLVEANLHPSFKFLP